MRIYVACHEREAAQAGAAVLEDRGHTIVSTWHKMDFHPTESHTEAERRAIAERDVAEVRRCDALVLIAGPDKYPGGKFVEAGIALGLCKRVIVVGRRENMLLWHPDILQAVHCDEAADLLVADGHA